MKLFKYYCRDCGREAVKESLAKYPIFRDTLFAGVKAWTHADGKSAQYPDERNHVYVGGMRVYRRWWWQW